MGEQGFTLLELIVVVAVLGVLVAIALQQFSLYR
ncbi:MAG TPA: prepilin-type N-terminal cleavage/methylation domain-containing protein, partial [Candidatus Binatia bacterium]|nr:prepilin-type N-terminal cleavage/methylation domain-containing protein [Candidatus Binatia bacterium]